MLASALVVQLILTALSPNIASSVTASPVTTVSGQVDGAAAEDSYLWGDKDSAGVSLSDLKTLVGGPHGDPVSFPNIETTCD